MAVGTVEFPGGLDTTTTLIQAVNKPSVGWPTLTLGILEDDEALALSDASGLPSSGVIAIENEIVRYSAIVGNELLLETRGGEGTTAAAHEAGVEVRAPITARHHNVLAEAVIAIETLLLGTGADLTVDDLNVGGDLSVSGDITLAGTVLSPIFISADVTAGISINDSSGSGVAAITFKDNGVTRWSVGKDLGDDFLIYNEVTGHPIFVVDDQTDAVGIGNADGGAITLDNAVVVNESGADKDTRIESANEENMIYVDASTDRVGFRTPAPGSVLHLRGDSTNIAAVTVDKFGADVDSPSLHFRKSRHATFGSHTVVQSGDDLGGVVAWGSDGDEFLIAGYMIFESDGTPGNGDMPGRIVFATTPDGSSTPAEAMRISQNKVATFWAPITVSVNGSAGISLDDTSGSGVAAISFKDNGTNQWSVGKGVSNNFSIYNEVTAKTDFSIDATNDAVMIGAASGLVGFFGDAGTTLPTITGSRGGNAALASLLTALAAMGLVVDSSS